MLEFYNHKYHIAREEHTCEFCKNTIKKKEKYSREGGKYEGKIFDRCLCLVCDKILQEFGDENSDEEFNWWNVSDWLREKRCHYCKDSNDCGVQPQRCEKIRKEYTLI